ncbi:MAG: CinA family nicotinamide mononucleotide deamidase-related protein [Dehalococcoidia bacterium]
MPSAEIISIGSELLLGQIVDTNATWMAQRLTEIGVNLYRKSVVGDNKARMFDVINQALERSDIVICGGGLGPTQDDITREVIAKVTHRKLILDKDLLNTIDTMFRSRGFLMTKNNERQAYIPEGSVKIHNPNGTAPSFAVEDPRGVVFALPGVPFELKWLFSNEVTPYLKEKFTLSDVISYKILKVAELGESNVDHLIGDLIADSSNPTVGVLAHPGQVDVRITAKAGSVKEADILIEPVEKEVRSLLGKHIFASNDQTMETVVGELLRKANITICSYEDVTQGMLCDRLQKASLDHFVEGIVGNGIETIDRLSQVKNADSKTKFTNTTQNLIENLALKILKNCGTELSVVLHGAPDISDDAENLARGKTFITVTDGKSFKSRNLNVSGRGNPDRIRTSFEALNLIRDVIQNGFEKEK